MPSRTVLVRYALTLVGVVAIALGALDLELLYGLTAPIVFAAGSLGFVLEARRTLNDGTPNDATSKPGRAWRIMTDLRFQGVVLVLLGWGMLEVTWLIDPVWLRRVLLGVIPCAGGALLGIAMANDAAEEAAKDAAAPEAAAEGPNV